MSSISTSNTYSVGSYTNKGMSGLISNMDTEGMVKQMLSGTQSKIDKATGEKQQWTWKQEIYRELIGDINSFYNQFFSLGSSTNLKNTNYFDAMVSTSSSSAFRVTGTPSATTGLSSMIVKQLANSYKAQTAGQASSNSLTGNFNADALKQEIVLEIGSDNEATTTVNIDLTGVATTQDVIDKINAAGTSNGFSAEIDKNGRLKITGNKVWVSGKSSALGLQMAGLTANTGGVKVKTDSSDYILTGKVPSADPEVNMTVALDGQQTTLKFKLADLSTAQTIRDAANTQLKNAFGTLNGSSDPLVKFDYNTTTQKFTLTAAGSGHQVSVGGSGAALAAIGLKSGQSNKISTSVALSDIAFNGVELSGEQFSFKINDEEFSFKKNATIYQVMKAVNNSGAGVRMTYSALDDKFTIENTSSGSGRDIRIEQTEGNLLTAMFGINPASSAVSKTLTTKTITSDGGSFADFKSGSLQMTVNGTTFGIGFSQKADESAYTKDEVVRRVNRALEERFGFAADGKANIALSPDGTSFDVKNGASVSFAEASGDAEKDAFNLAAQLGFAGKSNAATMDTTLADLGFTAADLAGSGLSITDKFGDFEGKPGITVEKYTDADGNVHPTGRLSLSAGAPADLKTALGMDGATFGDGSDANMNVIQKGQNAVVVINGVETERGSNTFTVNGLSFELLEVSKSTDVDNAFSTAPSLGDIAVGSVLKDSSGNTLGTYGGYGNQIHKLLNQEGKVIGSIAADGTVTYGSLNEKTGSFVIGTGSANIATYSTKTSFEPSSVSTERDTDQIFDGLKEFVEGYNKLVEKLKKYTDEEATYKSYSPLTTDQKKEMSENEIELWEKKAKEGLLRNDNDLSMFLTEMRTILYQKPADAKYALYDLGIETGSYSKKGQLVLDETKLKEMLKSDPEAVRQLFTDTTDGLASKLSNAIDKAAKLSTGSPGTLVQLAGYAGYGTDKNNTIYNDHILRLTDRIKDLTYKYEKERQRYWNQFNAMEQAIQNLNSQSSWLGMQFSG